MSEITVRIPGALQDFTGGSRECVVTAERVADVVARLGELHPQLVPRLLTPEGTLRPFVNVFVGPHNVRDLQGLDTPIPAGVPVTILPAVAGG
jgi:molybdopterin converting factor small subunit